MIRKSSLGIALIFLTFLLSLSSCNESVSDTQSGSEEETTAQEESPIASINDSVSLIKEGAINQAEDQEPKHIGTIRTWCKEINSSASNYKKVENPDIFVYKDMNPDNYAFESENIYRLGSIYLTRFYDDNELKKAVVYFNADGEDLTSEYYYHNDSLFFVFKNHVFYKMNKSSEGFDNAISQQIENRFYYQNDKLISWLGEDKKSKDLTSQEAIKKAKEVLSDAMLYKAYK